MPIQTSIPHRTVPLHECLTLWSSRIYAKAILRSQEVVELEIVQRLSSLLNGYCEGQRRLDFGHVGCGRIECRWRSESYGASFKATVMRFLGWHQIIILENKQR
jgi:hypothetical protein